MKLLSSVIMMVFLMVACERVADQPAAPRGETTGQTATQNGETATMAPPSELSAATIAVTTTKGVVNVTAEVAETPEERARGLMGRESLPAKNGMWFVFSTDVEDKFWMKDTFVPLDIIFVGSDNKVVDIIANAVPQSTELLGARAPYRFVLEVNGGFAEAHHIDIGDTVQFRIGPSE